MLQHYVGELWKKLEKITIHRDHLVFLKRTCCITHHRQYAKTKDIKQIYSTLIVPEVQKQYK